MTPFEPCQLLLLRHGIAADPAPGQADAERPLTEAGRRRTSAVLQRLVQLDWGCDRLLSSPLLRAQQTAELALAAGLAPQLELAQALAPGGEAPALLRTLQGHGVSWRRLALVGHEPDLSTLAAGLIGASPGSLQLKKAGVALLEWSPAGWQLLVLATPRLLVQ